MKNVLACAVMGNERLYGCSRKDLQGLDATERALQRCTDSPIIKAIESWLESPTAKALRDFSESPLAKTLRDFDSSPTAKALRDFSESPLAKTLRDFGNSPTAKALRDFGRAIHWAVPLADFSPTAFREFTHVAPFRPDMERVHSAAKVLAGVSSEWNLPRLTPGHVANDTHFRLRAYAGAADILGANAPTSLRMYDQLLGAWHTRLTLPDSFWQDPRVRAGYYTEAQVHSDLITSPPVAALEIAIESGVAAGLSDGAASIAILDVAGVTMQIRANDATVDAFRVITTLEQQLRQFISRKLESTAGSQWFKQRVTGAMHQKARDNRALALTNGEQHQALICYLDIGDLANIVFRRNNWNEVFAHIFPNRTRLEFDLHVLTALRRPTMHSRGIDAVQLIELLCVVRRLMDAIESDGEWKRVAESDE